MKTLISIFLFFLIGCSTTQKEYIVKPIYIAPEIIQNVPNPPQFKLDETLSLCSSKNIKIIADMILEYQNVIKKYREIIKYYEEQILFLEKENKKINDELEKLINGEKDGKNKKSK